MNLLSLLCPDDRDRPALLPLLQAAGWLQQHRPGWRIRVFDALRPQRVQEALYAELDSTPRRVNMDWAVKLEKPAFVGRDALLRTASIVDERRLFGFTMDGPAPLEGSVIRVDGEVVGHVTSSWLSPKFGHAVLLGWQVFVAGPQMQKAQQQALYLEITLCLK